MATRQLLNQVRLTSTETWRRLIVLLLSALAFGCPPIDGCDPDPYISILSPTNGATVGDSFLVVLKTGAWASFCDYGYWLEATSDQGDSCLTVYSTDPWQFEHPDSFWQILNVAACVDSANFTLIGIASAGYDNTAKSFPIHLKYRRLSRPSGLVEHK